MTSRTVRLTAGTGSTELQYRVDDGPWTTYTEPVTLADGAHRVDYRARGTNLIWGPTRSITAKVDGTAPQVAATTDPPSPTGFDGWFAGPVSLRLDATDAASGVVRTQYRFGARGTWTDYTVPVALPVGRTTVGYRAVDRAGNVAAEQTLTVARDDVAPVTTASVRTTPGSGTVSFAAADADSGVRVVRVRVDGGTWTQVATLVALGTGWHTVEYAAEDVAGNLEIAGHLRVRVTAARP